MSEQAVDLRSTLAVLRRHRVVLTSAALLGAAAGVTLVLARPAMYTSTSQVLLPPPAQNSSGQTTSRGAETEVRIAGSDVVLGPAGSSVSPKVSANTLGKYVTVSAPTTELIQIKAKASSPRRAEQLSRAVANSYVTYVKTTASPITAELQASFDSRMKALQDNLASTTDEITKTKARGQQEDPTSAEGKADATALAQLTSDQNALVIQIDQLKTEETTASQPLNSQTGAGASVIQDATPAARPALVGRLVAASVMGGLLFFSLVALALVIFGRRDRRLRSRDEIADALGSAVVASVHSRVPKGVAGWTTLLRTYAPETVDAWALRQALRQLVTIDAAPEQGADGEAAPTQRSSITVIALADDERGIAMAPQLASFAGSLGLGTRLVATQRHESAAALWAACSNLDDEPEVRPGLIVDAQPDRDEDVELTVQLVVVDRRQPELANIPKTTVTILAVSSGSATADDLARAAVAADDVGSRIDGILVADPDDLDRTTGRLSQQERAQRAPMPTRLTGPTDRRRTNVRRFPRRTS